MPSRTTTQPEPDERPAGLRCRTCGCRHFFTTHTRPLPNGRIRRYRACRNCGRRLTTIETPE